MTFANSGGMILNGGTLSGGTVAFSTPALIYAGSSNPSAISSALNDSSGLVKFGSGTLVLSANNSGLSGNIVVDSGALNIQNAGALGATGSGNITTVAAGASLEIQGNTAVGGNFITLNGTGLSGGGALQNVQMQFFRRPDQSQQRHVDQHGGRQLDALWSHPE